VVSDSIADQIAVRLSGGMDDLLLFVLVAGIDLAMGHPRMRHADPAIDAMVSAVIDRWHETEADPQLSADAVPGWLLSLPNQKEAAND
jgi:hypothetical protein